MVCNQRQAEPEWHKCYHISRNIGKHRRQTKLPEVINKPLDFFNGTRLYRYVRDTSVLPRISAKNIKYTSAAIYAIKISHFNVFFIFLFFTQCPYLPDTLKIMCRIYVPEVLHHLQSAKLLL